MTPERGPAQTHPEELERAVERLQRLREIDLAHLYSVADALQAAAEAIERAHRQSGGKMPPEFIVKAKEDDARIVYRVVELLEAAFIQPDLDQQGGDDA